MLLLILFATVGAGLPLQNNSSDTGTANAGKKVGWVEAPQARGTFDLLLSCLTTLSLCAWTAYHPNVFVTRNEWRKFGKRAMWMAIAVLAPEIVLWCAWEQWWASETLQKAVEKLGEKAFDGTGGNIDNLDDKRELSCIGCYEGEVQGRYSGDYGLRRMFEPEDCPPEPESEVVAPTEDELEPVSKSFSLLRPSTWKKTNTVDAEEAQMPATWTREQAFFAVSGGYAVDSSEFYPLPSLTLTPSALHFLARHGILPKICPTTISDKSKSNHVAKVLVCLQAGWFLLQAIARVAQKLPLTLLELHVLAHVGCAFAMYLLWMDKPYDVGAPVLVEGDNVRDLVALWALDDDSAAFKNISEDGAKRYCATYGNIDMDQVQTAHQNARSASTRHHYAQLVRNFVDPFLPKQNKSALSQPSIATSHEAPPTQEQDLHLRRARNALDYLSSHSIHFSYLTRTPTTDCLKRKPSIRFPLRYVTPTRGNLIIDGLPSVTKSTSREEFLYTALKAYTVMSVLYGSLHFCGWNHGFNSLAERWLWRGSAFVMAGAPTASLITAWLSNFVIYLYRYRKRIWGEDVWDGDEDSDADDDEAADELSTKKSKSQPLSWCANALHKAPFSTTAPTLPSSSYLRRLKATTPGVVAGTVSFIHWTFYHVIRLLTNVVLYAMFSVALMGWVLYLAARLYVLVESFASLRASDARVYRMVEWSNYLPHAG
ncbi:unnamed protein product [Periconia digitata]|uniref:Uncharacterized protein n=1 Tax=Periconia digitata TaxID=1303443 RepID=A0A9W4XR89_9PLEO|nr:unnamed protein product [Periconia digitata]